VRGRSNSSPRTFPGASSDKAKTRDRKATASAEPEKRKKKDSNRKAESPRPGGVIPELNRKIVAFAVNNLGRRVGDGECWTLAAEALKQSGAQPPRGYVFGRAISLKEASPGDILQFKTARFETARERKLLGTPNHTAIVYATRDGKTFVLHQNFGSKKVTTLDLDFQNLVSGSVIAYRPLAASAGSP